MAGLIAGGGAAAGASAPGMMAMMGQQGQPQQPLPQQNMTLEQLLTLVGSQNGPRQQADPTHIATPFGF